MSLTLSMSADRALHPMQAAKARKRSADAVVRNLLDLHLPQVDAGENKANILKPKTDCERCTAITGY